MRIRGILRRVAMAVALMSLAACAGPKDTFVVLPKDDGSVGSIVVHKGGKDVVLDNAYAATDGGKTYTAEGGNVQKVFGDALSAQPLPPKSFILYFEEGSTKLVPSSKPVLQEIFADVAKRPSAEIAVIGHTDRVGTVADNDVLSRKRAAAVVEFLAQNGAKRESMTASGRGEREPLIPTKDEVAEPRNRRVEISVR